MLKSVTSPFNFDKSVELVLFCFVLLLWFPVKVAPKGLLTFLGFFFFFLEKMFVLSPFGY